ncbi:phosphatidate cytidylyltransferase [Aliigemmobacter aestuarii]|nr:phosphatidate cytidylyltransferase [Gemmobacter aestuarii]
MSGAGASGGAAGARWGDLKARVLSAIVMIVVGLVEIWLGGWPFAALVILACGAMIWELARMTEGRASLPPVGLGVLGAAALLAIELLPQDRGWTLPVAAVLAALPSLAGLPGGRRHRRAFVPYAFLIMLTGLALISLRADPGLPVILWIVAVVVASDVAGYFAGRTIGGPKFWPAISPKKTWSGTIAGWIGAALVGLVFVQAGWGGWGLVALSPLVAFTGQMGDIAESWIKRRTGVKDSSNLIPGHGGVMDRFDALATATVLVWALSFVMPLPLAGG